MQLLAGALAALWIGLLWYASPLAGGENEPADRVRGVLVLGVGIPFVLGFAHLLYAPSLLLVAVALCALQRARSSRTKRTARSRGARNAWTSRVGVALLVFTAIAAAWPPLVRPLLEGDSLSYHFANAAAWVQSGSLWETGTRYWWYPGGSELFAAGLLAISGPFSVGLAGTLALLLLGLRIYRWSLRMDAPALLGGAASAATLATVTVGLQAGNLLNDVWLGAFFLEVLYDARYARNKIGLDAAVCALVKPVGFAFAAYGLIAARRFDVQAFVPVVAFGAWVFRDAILWNHAIIPAQTTVFPELFRTTIAGNGSAAFAAAARAVAADGAWTVVLAVAPLLGLLTLKDRALCIAGILALAAYAFLPFSYRNYVPQLEGGQSLRFAVPAFAVGAVVSVELLRRAWLVAVPLALAAAWFGLERIGGVFWVDPNTHVAVVVAAAFALALTLLPDRARAASVAALAAIAIVVANVTAARDATARYDESLGNHTRFFEWLANTRPPRVVVSDIPAGAILAISPQTRTYDVLDLFPCDEARTQHALLVFLERPPPEKTLVPQTRAEFANCGPTVYDDGVVRVLRPPGV